MFVVHEGGVREDECVRKRQMCEKKMDVREKDGCAGKKWMYRKKMWGDWTL